MNVGIILSIGAGILMGAALMWFVLRFPISKSLFVPQKPQWLPGFLAKIRPILSLKSVYKATVAGVITILTVLVIDVSALRSQDVTQQGIANYDLQTGAMQISTDLYATNGNVGIGTTSPQEKLDVAGNIIASGTICDSNGCIGSGGASVWSTSGANIYYSGGNVGIGITSPGRNLDVHDDANNATIGVSSGAGHATLEAIAAPGYNAVLRLLESANIRWVLKNVSSDGNKLIFTGNGTDRVTIDQAGFVGIGTTSPSVRLDVRPRYANAIAMGLSLTDGSVAVGFGLSNLSTGGAQIRYSDSLSFMEGTTTRMFIAPTTGNVGIGDSNPEQRLTVYDKFLVRGNNPTITISDDTTPTDRWVMRNQNGAFKLYFDSANPAITVQTSGNVGIGLTSPTQALDVAGNIRASGTICDVNGCIGNGGSSVWNNNGAKIYYNSDNVGIGTSNPKARLDVRPSSANTMAMGLSRNDGNVMVGFGLSNLSTGGAQIRYGDSLSFVGGTTTRMYINESNGYVGIGLTSPTQALDVVGNIKASGRMCDSYGCISNWITSGANVYYNGGNVGIGTTAPTARLTIADTISPGQRLLDVGDDAYFTDLDEANAIGLYGIQDSSQVTLQFGSGGARIWGKSNGDICIGNCP